MITAAADQYEAMRCALGGRQRLLVAEMLKGPIYVERELFMRITTPVYGKARLPYSSFKPLKKRLEASGFKLVFDRKMTDYGNRIELVSER